MDLLDKLVGGAGCGPDGAAAARNPLGRLVDQFLDSAQATNKGEMRSQPGPMMGGGAAEAYMEGLRRGMADADGMMMMPPPPPPGAMLHGPPPPPPMMMARGPPPARVEDPWAEEFMRHERHVPPEAGAKFRPELEEAFIESEKVMLARRGGEEEAAWAREFVARRGPPMPPPHMHMRGAMPPAQSMEAAWVEAGTARSQIDVQWELQEAWEEEAAAVNGSIGSRRGVEEVRGASGEVLRALSGASGVMDGKMARSEFVGFMRQLHEGSVEIEEEANTVVPGQGGLEAQWDLTGGGDLDQAWQQAAVDEGPPLAAGARPAGVLEEEWAKGLDEGVRKGLEEQWRAATEDGAEADLDEMWRAAVEANAETGGTQDMDDFWDRLQGLASEYEAAQAGGGKAGGGLESAWAQSTQEPYQFTEENRFLDTEDPFAQGMRLFDAGELSSAILAFEAELQVRPDNAEAWRMLGTSHAENDEDKRAIACLERAVEHDPYNLPALLALGVSYVNELDSPRALQNLKAWVEHNPKYQGLEIRSDEYSDGSLMDEVMQLMLQANDWDVASNGREDADVQVVLGVLYNVSQDYDSAIEAFEKALKHGDRQHDYSLWNKLGATLANSQRSEEALPAYHRALDIKPKYARAWLNMGISYANLNKYEQAAACYLQALKLNPEATHIWGYLRVTFTAMERFDLVQLASSQDPHAFDGEFSSALE